MNLRDLFQQLTWRSGIDIVLVGALFYQIIAMLKGTRAAQVLIGMLVIFLTYVLSSLLELETLNWIISKFYSSFIFVVIVLFQDDIRRLLTRFGRGPFVSGLDENSGLRVIEEVVNAAKNLSHDRIGAIIVFERGIGLDRLYDHAVRVDALVSEQLLVCIFQSFSPLHDGAVIVQKNRMSCASAQLPLSKNPLFSKKLGTRHSAAVGISEETDSIVLVVSEETGNISIASDGQIQRQHSIDAARRLLVNLLMPRAEKSTLRRWFEKSVWERMRKPEPKTKGERGHSASSSEAAGDLRGAAEYENRLASAGTALHLRFPRYSRIKTAKADGSNLILSNRMLDDRNATGAGSASSMAASRASGAALGAVGELGGADQDAGKLAIAMGSAAAHASLPETNAEGRRRNGNEDFEPDEDLNILDTDSDLNDVNRSTSLDDDGAMQNEAAVSLSHLGPQDKFVPPVPPTPPPRDVSIGGVSLNPPIDKTSSDSDAKKRSSETEPEGEGS